MSTSSTAHPPGTASARRRPALLLTAPGRFTLSDINEPVMSAGEVAVDVLYTGLCGTDLHIVDGKHPRATFPLALGHEIVGLTASGTDPGQLVVVDPLASCGTCTACASGIAHVCTRLRLTGIDSHGGLAGRVVVPVERLHRVPSGIAPEVAALAEPLAVAVHAARRTLLSASSKVVIVGAGPIGLLLALVVRQAGVTELFVSEPAPARRRTAAALGLTVLDADDPVGDLAVRTDGWLADAVFDAAAVPAVAAILPSLVRPGGTIALVGVYGGPTPVDLMAVVFRETTLVGNRVYTPADIDRAIELLLPESAVDVRRLISAIVPVTETPAAIERLRDGDGVKLLIDVGTLT